MNKIFCPMFHRQQVNWPLQPMVMSIIRDPSLWKKQTSSSSHWHSSTFQPYFRKQELILDRLQEHEGKVTLHNPIWIEPLKCTPPFQSILLREAIGRHSNYSSYTSDTKGFENLVASFGMTRYSRALMKNQRIIGITNLVLTFEWGLMFLSQKIR